MTANRRQILIATVPLSQVSMPSTSFAAPKAVDPNDPQAKALGYTPDADKVPDSFSQKHATGAHCGNCALFQGKGSDAPGPCPLFGGKSVQGNGWCGSWVSK